ncbi:MAG: NHLP bacteriocin system secretion protein [Butyrivibrio sp.]|nr:NHLP bacteriocin system secretion protein [Butyrivibrio sp.]
MEQLSSMEQLDKAVVITSPATWFAMLGAALIIAAAFIWSVFGRIPQNVTANGILIDKDGVHTVYSEADGTIESFCCEIGDHVERGDEIMKLSSTAYEKKISDLMARRSELEKTADESNAYTTIALMSLDMEIDEYERKLEAATIRAPYDGVITEFSVAEGQVIASGDYVARISRNNKENTVAVCYVPVAEGRKIKNGMTASIYPSTANKQEYGHMKGTVTYVDEYVTSRAEIVKQVGVVSLAESFLSDGPVIEVRFLLDRDENSANGYWWSSKRGREIDLESGTIISVDIVVKEVTPISLVIPFFSESVLIAENMGD